MELEFIAESLLAPVKPCLMICGIGGHADWARDALRRDFTAYKIVEQEQFVPFPKQSAKDKSRLKHFSVAANWLEDFYDRFVVIVELFVLGEPEMDVQLVEDILFAAKYANEFKYEHVAVICCESVSAQRMAAFKKDICNLSILIHSSLNTAPIQNQVKQLSNNCYKENLVKKYKKRMLTNSQRFLAPWQCRSHYSFKSAIAFQAAGEYGNALRDYHSCYTAIIEEGNQLVVKGEGKKGLCEYTREHADVILLRMVGCMLKLGSGKEAAAFLRGHLTWYCDAFSDAIALVAWKIVLYCHYGWIMELYNSDNSGSLDPIYCPSLYYSQAIQLACKLLATQPLSPASITTLNNVALTCVQQCESKPHRSLKERVQMVRFLYLTHQLDTVFDWIDQCLSVRSLDSWKAMVEGVLRIAVELRPNDIQYCWQLASVTRDYTGLERALAVERLECLEVGHIYNDILALLFELDRLTGIIGQSAIVNMEIVNKSQITIPLSRTAVTFSDGHQIERPTDLLLTNSSMLKVPFDIKGPVGEHSITSVTLFTRDFAVGSFKYDKKSFSSENNVLKVVRPAAYLTVKAEAVIGLINGPSQANLIIENQAHKPVQGVIKVTKVPNGLDFSASFPFGVSAKSTNTVKLPMSSADRVDGELKFDIDYTCEQHDCEPMTDLAVPVLIEHPVEVSVFRYRRVRGGLDPFEDLLSVTVKRKREYVVGKVDVQIGDQTFEINDDPIVTKSPSTRLLSVHCSIGGKRYSMDVCIPNLPYRPAYGLITNDNGTIILVNEHPDPITTVIEVDKKGQVFLNGPKRLTVTLPPHTHKQIPISVTSLSDMAHLTLLMDGQPACPEWLKCD